MRAVRLGHHGPSRFNSQQLQLRSARQIDPTNSGLNVDNYSCLHKRDSPAQARERAATILLIL